MSKFLFLLSFPALAFGAKGLDKSEINQGMQKAKKQVVGCYEPALKTNPKLEGKVSVKFTITPEGKVTEVGIKESTVNDPAVENCIVTAVEEITFAAAELPTTVKSYPFTLKPFQKTVFTHKKQNPMVPEGKDE